MQRGIITEYEWRRRMQQAGKAMPDWWGAQCVYPAGMRKWTGKRCFRLILITLSLTVALAIPALTPVRTREVFEDYPPANSMGPQVRKVSAVSYQLPAQLDCLPQIFTRVQLIRGRMMLIDAQHPAPADLPPPNTVSIAQYGNGMVPVRSLSICSGYETIAALKSLFSQLRSTGAEGLYVCQGSVSVAQQRQTLVRQTRLLMKTLPPDEAAGLARKSFDLPGTGSLLQEYTVEICTSNGQRLEEDTQGQRFLQLCWRYGFVRESSERPFRFRYVGKAHATAMTYLNLDLKAYLDWLHQKGIITVMAGGQPKYLILCSPLQGDYASFMLPANAACEISLDNMGYALAACTL